MTSQDIDNRIAVLNSTLELIYTRSLLSMGDDSKQLLTRYIAVVDIITELSTRLVVEDAK